MPAQSAELRNKQSWPETDKWALLREVTMARKVLGLNDRDLSVLEVLLSFIPGKTIGAVEKLVVHPSNATLCQRLNGMPCSTLRRHLANLLQSGLIARHDSPNGKRYVRRDSEGVTAFGFDLSPLLARRIEIEDLADQARSAALALKRLRENISLMRRDLIAAGGAEELLLSTARLLRRQLSQTELQDIADLLQAELPAITEEVSITHNQNEHHYQNPVKDHFESEGGASPSISCSQPDTEAEAETKGALSLTEVLTHCPQISEMNGQHIQSWSDLCRASERLRPMMGIPAAVWLHAQEVLGNSKAAVVLAAMLQRFEQIRSPGAYLRHLAQRAEARAFSPWPMVKALNAAL